MCGRARIPSPEKWNLEIQHVRDWALLALSLSLSRFLSFFRFYGRVLRVEIHVGFGRQQPMFATTVNKRLPRQMAQPNPGTTVSPNRPKMLRSKEKPL